MARMCEFNSQILSPFYEKENWEKVSATETSNGVLALFRGNERICQHTHTKYDLLEWVYSSYQKKTGKNRFLLKDLCKTCYKAKKIAGLDYKKLIEFFDGENIEYIVSTNASFQELNKDPDQKRELKMPSISESFYKMTLQEFLIKFKEAFSGDDDTANNLNDMTEIQLAFLSIMPKPVKLEMIKSILDRDRVKNLLKTSYRNRFQNIISMTEGVGLWIFLLIKIYTHPLTYDIKNSIKTQEMQTANIKRIIDILDFEFEIFNQQCGMGGEETKYISGITDIFVYIKESKGNCYSFSLLVYYLIQQIFNFSNMVLLKWDKHVDIGIIGAVDGEFLGEYEYYYEPDNVSFKSSPEVGGSESNTVTASVYASEIAKNKFYVRSVNSKEYSQFADLLNELSVLDLEMTATGAERKEFWSLDLKREAYPNTFQGIITIPEEIMQIIVSDEFSEIYIEKKVLTGENEMSHSHKASYISNVKTFLDAIIIDDINNTFLEKLREVLSLSKTETHLYFEHLYDLLSRIEHYIKKNINNFYGDLRFIERIVSFIFFEDILGLWVNLLESSHRRSIIEGFREKWKSIMTNLTKKASILTRHFSERVDSEIPTEKIHSLFKRGIKLRFLQQHVSKKLIRKSQYLELEKFIEAMRPEHRDNDKDFNTATKKLGLEPHHGEAPEEESYTSIPPQKKRRKTKE